MKKIRDNISTLLWIVLLAVLGVASTSSVRWISPSLHIQNLFGPAGDLSHALVLGMLILTAAALTPKTNHPFWSIFLKISVGLLVAGVVLSTILATDTARAMYTGSGMLIGVILMLTTYKLADQPWKIHLALIVIVALGAVFSTKVWSRELVEMDQLQVHYEENREEFWSQQGKELDDPTVLLFEARLKSRDNGGFFFHGNLGGMYLATVFLVSLGLVFKRFDERRQPFGNAWLTGAILLSGFIFSGLMVTYSKGAIASALAAAMIITVIWVFRGSLRRRFRSAVIGTCLLISLAGGVVIGYGLTKNTLPTLSMAYRWEYWVASYHMFVDHPMGVGSGNYTHYYQRYKLSEAEEEITSPHNTVVQGFTELGVLGGIGLTLLPAAIFYQLARRRKSRWDEQPLSDAKKNPGPSAIAMMLAVSGGIFGLLMILNPMGLAGPVHFLAQYLVFIVVFLMAFILASVRADRFDQIDNSPPQPILTLCLAGGLIAMILGEMVNFSLEEPPTQILFFFVAGLALATVQPPTPSKAWLSYRTGVFGLFLFAYIAGLAVPAIRAEKAANQSHLSVAEPHPHRDRAYQTFVRLAEKYPHDAHLAAQTGRRLMELAQINRQPTQLLEQAAEWFAEAQKRAPSVWEFPSQEGQCYMILAELNPERAENFYAKAQESFERARELAPQSKNLALTLGLVYTRHIGFVPEDQEDRRMELSKNGLKHLQNALELDEALPRDSLRRFSPQKRHEIQSALHFLNSIP